MHNAKEMFLALQQTAMQHGSSHLTNAGLASCTAQDCSLMQQVA